MATATRVPLNTMLADLDETLRVLLRRELGVHGFDGVDVAFEAPAKDWSAALSAPTINLFLYDLRESRDHRPIDWDPRRGDGRQRELRPPLRLNASYAVSAWTRTVEDEHRLLSQVLAVLYAYPALPEDLLVGTLPAQAERFAVEGRIAQERADAGADFWAAVGGQYKASLDYIVTLTCDSGTELERGPEVRTQTVRLGDRDVRGTVVERHRLGGTLVDDDGRAVPDAWVLLLTTGGWAVTDDAGRFGFVRVPTGPHQLRVRSADGTETAAACSVPGAPVDLVLSRRPSGRRR